MKSRKKLWIMLIVAICTGAFSYRYYYVNKNFPPAQIIKYEMFQTVEMEDVQYTVTGTGVFENCEVNDEKIYYVKLNVYNDSDSESEICLADIKLKYRNNSVFISSAYFMQYNQCGVILSLEPKEKISVILPYRILIEDVPKNNFDNILKCKIELTFSIYPQKRYVEL